ncbi:hypothetical protein FK949_gp259 [Paramecium bursaria Chlorella virus NYs1]|uniref:Uncharacterized protein n=1 Tax=Paramecium bursaria Chlorella virus NYs1 TaxID=83442 RepID=M1I994_9PHYC|nr:hypothetical protein FK949_gp259 [Paramecium bursaria Chlorella virus NYs1]AGE55049.1 hypothetical protein PBCVMA1D_731L [Paramecium bursaria Chlorella virus MA1D]AGE58866.1 hypothetical protein PBCVNYs1_739L [Paramecium bursaria Chlorella virus NYs1]
MLLGMHIILILLLVAIVAAAAFYFMKKRKEKFIMKLYRPTPVVSVPSNTWDPADILTAVLPSKTGPKLVVEKGDYRRFNRI